MRKDSYVHRLFEKARSNYQALRFDEAEQLCKKILKAEPQHDGSLYLRGLIAYQSGHYQAAVELLSGAIGFKNDEAVYHNALGAVLQAQRNIEDAAAAYQRAISLRPDFAQAHNNLGSLRHIQGNIPDAIACYRRALAIRPNYAEALNNLGNQLQAQGTAEEAMECYHRAIAARPDYADAYSNLAQLLEKKDRPDEALKCYERAVLLDPAMAVAHRHMGRIFYARGALDDSIASFERALGIQPDCAELHNELGTALHDRGELADAEKAYNRAIAINPLYVEAIHNLGCVLHARGRYAEAAECYRRVHSLESNHARSFNNLGNALQSQGQLDQAAEAYERAIAIDPSLAEAHYNYGRLLLTQGNLTAATVSYERALALNPEQVEALNNLGNILRDQGKFDEALQKFDRAIAINPGYAEAHFNRAAIRTFSQHDIEMRQLEQLAKDVESHHAGSAPYIHFAYAKALEDVGDYERAFAQLSKGNFCKRQLIDYDEPAIADYFRRISAAFGSHVFERLKNAGHPSTLPIFVLGMPRSGTSLVEQVLSSHPQVHGGGELTTFDAALTDVLHAYDAGAGYPECMSTLEPAALHQIGEAYLARLPAVPTGNIRITDKLPANFFNIGLIFLTFPSARIIHVVRNPIDTCVSCYSKLFSDSKLYSDTQLFSYDLAELGRYYRYYERLMDHWRSVLPPNAMIEISYESLVADFENQSRRIVDYCGLQWDDRCLAFYETKRTITTASVFQVRQPLYSHAVERWRRFEPFIRPLIDELGMPPIGSSLPAECDPR